MDKVAANAASMVEDGSCLSIYSGLLEALGKHLARKRNLGVHSYFFTDVLMDLVKSGAVNNKKKGYFQDKCLTSYAQGTPELFRWMHENPLIEFQAIDVVSDHLRISLNDRFMAILPARKISLTGSVALRRQGQRDGRTGQARDFFSAAEHSAAARRSSPCPAAT